MTDYITAHFDAPYLVAITAPVMLETPDEAICQVFQRGLYPFTNKKKALAFTRDVNETLQEETAFLFTRPKPLAQEQPTKEETNAS